MIAVAYTEQGLEGYLFKQVNKQDTYELIQEMNEVRQEETKPKIVRFYLMDGKRKVCSVTVL